MNETYPTSLPSQGPSSAVSYGRLAAVPAPSYSQKIARQILDGAETWTVELGGGFGLDLATESCELCGGCFARRGLAAMLLNSNGDPLFLHTGCWRETEEWA